MAELLRPNGDERVRKMLTAGVLATPGLVGSIEGLVKGDLIFGLDMAVVGWVTIIAVNLLFKRAVERAIEMGARRLHYRLTSQ